MLGEYTLQDIDVEGLAATFATKTDAGRVALLERLSQPTADTTVMDKRIAEIRRLRRHCKENAPAIAAARLTLAEAEVDVRAVADAHRDKRHAEYYNQILWDPASIARRLNDYGWLTELVVFFRTLFLPGLSVVMPLSIFLMPLILFRYVIKQPLTWSGYFGMISAAIKKAMPSVLGAPRLAARGGVAAAGEQVVHMLAGVAVFIGSIWNQISAARNMRRVVADMRLRAGSVRRMTDAVATLGRLLDIPVAVPSWPMGDMGVFGAAWNTPTLAAQLMAEAGRLDMLVAIATQRRTCFPTRGDHIALTDLYHPGTGSKRVLNTVVMGGTSQPHVLLTGPNRGGKSTLLKSIGAATLMAQTVGVVFARRAVLPNFHGIITALNPADTIGKMSLFEAEIEFAKRVRATIAAAPGPVFLMMDEIFHGTNAHDGVEASQVFLDDLYAEEEDGRVFSVISTHYMGLPERYGGKQTQNLCMDAHVDSANPERLIYTYRLKAGVNTLSSVREILRERGLIGEKTSVPASKE